MKGECDTCVRDAAVWVWVMSSDLLKKRKKKRCLPSSLLFLFVHHKAVHEFRLKLFPMATCFCTARMRNIASDIMIVVIPNKANRRNNISA